jgi:hypothetical protein
MIVERIVWAVLLSHLGLTVAAHVFAPIRRKLSRYDRLGLLPNWSFFAPIPGTTDLRLVYRDRAAGSELTEWKEVDYLNTRVLGCILWNPNKHLAKCLTDGIRLILEDLADEARSKYVPLSSGYLMVWDILKNRHDLRLSDERQFSILVTTNCNRTRTVKVAYLSKFHREN